MPTEELFGSYMFIRHESDTVYYSTDDAPADNTVTTSSSITIAINGVHDTIADDPGATDAPVVLDYTATDDLWL